MNPLNRRLLLLIAVALLAFSSAALALSNDSIINGFAPDF